MSFLSETEIPNKGWMFRQPQTNWSMPNPISNTLDEATDLLLKHRLKNPAVVAQHSLSTNFYEVKQEIKEFNAKRLGLPPPTAPKFMPHLLGVAGAVVGHVGKTVAGVKLLGQWFGAGMKPVANELAEKRASICAKCPQNQKGDLWQRLDALAAREIKLLIEAKNQLALKTSFDDKLQTCISCNCYNQLKVHVPLEHVLKNTAPEVTSQLHPACWILNEA